MPECSGTWSKECNYRHYYYLNVCVCVSSFQLKKGKIITVFSIIYLHICFVLFCFKSKIQWSTHGTAVNYKTNKTFQSKCYIAKGSLSQHDRPLVPSTTMPMTDHWTWFLFINVISLINAYLTHSLSIFLQPEIYLFLQIALNSANVIYCKTPSTYLLFHSSS